MNLSVFSSAIDYLCQNDFSAKWDAHVENINNIKFFKLEFNSTFHEQIVTQLRDTDISNLIWDKYCELIFPHIEEMPEVQKILEKWLLEHLFILRCSNENHLKKLKEFSELDSITQHLKEFFSAIQYDLIPIETRKQKILSDLRVAIIAPSTGGEWMIAQSIKDYLKKHSIKTTILDSNPEDQEDILNRYCGMPSKHIYSIIFQQMNDPKLAEDIWWKVGQLRSFIVDNAEGILRKKVEKLNPDLLISTRYFGPWDVRFIESGMEVRFLNCDFQFQPGLIDIARKVESNLVKFWVPSPTCLVSCENIIERTEVLGYPIRLTIQKEDNLNKIRELKEKLGIQENKKVMLMMMGRQGFGKVLLPVIEKINSSGEELGQLHIIIVCGNNLSMYEEIVQFVERNPKKPNFSFQVEGLVEVNELANYYKIANVFFGKPGGSTTAELIHMKVFALFCESYELEKPNLDHTIDLGLGLKLDPNPNLWISQLQDLLNRDTKTLKYEDIDWRGNIIKSIRGDFEL